MKTLCLLLLSATSIAYAQTPTAPDWAQPGSAMHKQVPPPADFHRTTRTENKPLGVFEGQSDVGAALVAGSSSYDAAKKKYTVNSAGYNIWYGRDEFRFVWKKTSGDVSLAADVTFPDPKGYNDRKAVLVIRQNLEDDSKEIMAGEHGTGMTHLAMRPEKGAIFKDYEYRLGTIGMSANDSPTKLVNIMPNRIGIEKHGDEVSLWMSLEGEPMHQFGPPMKIHFDGPFYVGIGFTSHLPTTSDAAVLSDVVLVNSAGKVR